MTPVLAQGLRADRAFERVYRRHLGDVYRYALAVLHNPADAEDVTQTTFMNAYRAFRQGERPRNAQNWLIAIAHNVCRQRFRQSQRRPEEVAYDDGIGEVVPEEETGPTAVDIQRALKQLAFNQRAALVMRELEGRSYAEIAEILDLSVSAVETLIFRARRALREQLEGSLTCIEAERAISLQTDGKLSRAERGALRAHLRECAECARLARSQRAQRTAFKALAAVPIPTSLTSLFGGGGAAAGGGVAVKTAAFVAAGAVATGVGYEGVQRLGPIAPEPRKAAPAAVQRPAAAPTPSAALRERAVAPTKPIAKAKPEPNWKAKRPEATNPEAKNPKLAQPAPPERGHGRATAPGQEKKAVAGPAKQRANPKAQPPRAKPSPPKRPPRAAKPHPVRKKKQKARPPEQPSKPAPPPAERPKPPSEPKLTGPKLAGLPVEVPPLELPYEEERKFLEGVASI